MRLFCSKELEGKHRGLVTVFVEGDISSNRILAAVAEHKAEQVYFGARYMGDYGDASLVSLAAVRAVAEASPAYFITIETTFENFVMGTVIGLLDIMEKYLNVELMIPVHGLKSTALASVLERSEEHTSELQSLRHLVCRLL